MRYCTNCGHQLGIGRYCTNCGARVPVPAAEAPRSQEDFPTSVRPGEVPPLHPYGDDPLNTEPPPPPPPLGPPPSSARYPLFAETVAAAPAAVPPPVAAPEAAPLPTTPAPRRRSATPWVIAFLALAAIAAVGGILLLVGGSGEKDADDPAPGAHGPGRTQEAPSQDSADDGTDGAAAAIVPADVDVPGTAPASVDTDGTRVTFDAGNMLDDDPRTCWRTPGDATGATLTFTFDAPVTLTEVGLVNGYAKTDPPHDWYHGNRRITDVVWTFDDGTEVEQHLGADDTSVQSTDVDDVQTTSVELRIVGVTAPGKGADARDYTAISEAAFSGR